MDQRYLPAHCHSLVHISDLQRDGKFGRLPDGDLNPGLLERREAFLGRIERV